MSDAQAHDLHIQLQDGAVLVLRGEDQNKLVSTGFTPSGAADTRAVPNGEALIGFGPWPGWTANTSNRVATEPDADSGMFEPERLFVLREQYAFLQPAGTDAKARSLGPIHKAWWAGTEHVVQARQVSGRH